MSLTKIVVRSAFIVVPSVICCIVRVLVSLLPVTVSTVLSVSLSCTYDGEVGVPIVTVVAVPVATPKAPALFARLDAIVVYGAVISVGAIAL